MRLQARQELHSGLAIRGTQGLHDRAWTPPGKKLAWCLVIGQPTLGIPQPGGHRAQHDWLGSLQAPIVSHALPEHGTNHLQ